MDLKGCRIEWKVAKLHSPSRSCASAWKHKVKATATKLHFIHFAMERSYLNSRSERHIVSSPRTFDPWEDIDVLSAHFTKAKCFD